MSSTHASGRSLAVSARRSKVDSVHRLGSRAMALFSLEDPEERYMAETISRFHDDSHQRYRPLAMKRVVNETGHRVVILAGMAFANQIERLAGEERRAAARERRKAQGLPWGRPRRIQDDEELSRIVALRKDGRSVRAISMAVRIPRATIARALKQA